MAKVALLIGVSDYEPGLNSLPSAIKDAEAMRQVLVRPEIGEFSESDITVLTNPDRQNMEEEIERLFSNRHKDDLVLLFFSGHGIKDDTGRLYLATRQTRRTTQGDLIRSSAVAASFIHDNMERSRSKRQVVILDSCFSGAFAVGLSAKDDGNVNIFEQLGGEGRAVLTSSSSTQYSFEQQESDLSVYTKHLIEGIATGAADANDDGFVSIGELHEYARHKVKETYPAMKPEIYPGKEGYTIRLCKVPPGDPKEKYRKEVRRYIGCGDVDFIGRKILDALRNRLGLTEAETKLIEDEILASARQEVHEKLQRYEHDFSDALLQDPPLSEANLDLLRQNLKQILELKTEDIQTIEQQVRTSIETYQRHLNEYEQLFTEAVIKERPLIITTRNRLHEIQQQWKLKSEDITSIEIRVTAERKAHQQKLRQYEKTLRDLARHEYPFSEESYQTLNKEQKQLALTDEDIAQIRLQVKAEIDAYQQNLKDYEQAFKHVLQHEKEITDENREELKRYQAVLELRDEDIARTEAELVYQHEALHFTDEGSESSKRLIGTQTGSIDITSDNKSKNIQLNKENYKESLKYKKKPASSGMLKLFVHSIIVTIFLILLSVYFEENKQSIYEEWEPSFTVDKFQPSDAAAFNNRGVDKKNLGDYKGAIAEYDQAIQLQPDYANAYYNRGLAKSNSNDQKGAIIDFQQAATLYQKQGKTQSYLDALSQLGKLQ